PWQPRRRAPVATMTSGSNTPSPGILLGPVTALGASQAMLRSLCTALFLTHAGPQRLPLVFIAVDLTLGLFSLWLPRGLRRREVGSVFASVLMGVTPLLTVAILLAASRPGPATSLLAYATQATFLILCV